MFLITLPTILKNDLKSVKNLYIITYILGLGLGLYCTFLALNTTNYIRFRPSENVNPIWLARSLGVSLISAFFLFNLFKSKLLKFALILMTPFFIYPILISGSRAPFLGVILALIFYIFLKPNISGKKKIVLLPLGIILILSFFLLSKSMVASRLTAPTRVDLLSTYSRLIAWNHALKCFLGSPLFGIGTGGFYLKFVFIIIIYPHNLFLELASETGIIGLLLILSFVYFSIKYGLSNLKNEYHKNSFLYQQLSITTLTLFCFTLWNAMFSGDIIHNEIVWFCAGLVWVLHSSSEQNTKLMKQI